MSVNPMLTANCFFSPRHSFCLPIPYRPHPARSGAARGFPHSVQKFLQYHCIVVLFILRSEQQGQPSSLVRQTIEFIECLCTFRSRQLFQITPAESRPSSGTGMKPLPQSVRRRQLAQPPVHRRAFFAQAAWPEAIHQHARPVGERRLFVDSLHRYSFRSHSGPRARLGFALLL